MTLIERVRAVLAAGTPGPLHVETTPKYDEARLMNGHTVRALLDGRQLTHEAEDARKLALAVNLAPALVALWEAAEKRVSSNVRPFAQEAHADLLEALAALNEAATREVGE